MYKVKAKINPHERLVKIKKKMIKHHYKLNLIEKKYVI